MNGRVQLSGQADAYELFSHGFPTTLGFSRNQSRCIKTCHVSH